MMSPFCSKTKQCQKSIGLILVLFLTLIGCQAQKSSPELIDLDFDGIWDSEDKFPNDTDNDGLVNDVDDDDDNDGVVDSEDAFPYNPREWEDTDGDGIGNNQDEDDDGDGILDESDVFPLNASESADLDQDGIGDNADPDNDNDGFSDDDDLFPNDATQAGDHDNDGVDSLEDLDDDNDGYLDAIESSEGSNPLDANSAPIDSDGDGLTDRQEQAFGSDPNVVDTDNDGLADNTEFALQTNPQSIDTDNDGHDDLSEVGNDLNALPDFDEDGIIDAKDYFNSFPFRQLENDPQPINDRFGICVDHDRLIWVADSLSHQIAAFSVDGSFITQWGQQGNNPGELFFPNDVSCTVQGDFYVANTHNNRLDIFDSSTQFLSSYNRQPDGGPGGFIFPRGVDLDSANNIYVADTLNHRFQIYQNETWYAFSEQGTNQGQLQYPTDIAVNQQGEVAIADNGNFRVQVFDSSGVVLFEVNADSLNLTPFNFEPMSLDYGTDGYLYILDAAESRVVVVQTENGAFVRQFGSEGVQDGELLFPSGIHVDESNKVYVTDRYRVQIF